MAFCLPTESANKMLDALKMGKIVPEKLINMSSAERRAFFEPLVGKENVKDVNAQFEAKLLLKDQKKGLVNWARKLTGLNRKVRADMIAKIEKLQEVLTPATEKAFLEDLVSKKLGTDVTLPEAQLLADLSKETAKRKAAISPDSPIRSQERMEYGLSREILSDQINKLKLEDTRSIPKQIIDFATSPGKIIVEVAGIAKSLVASLDNSFFGRQGLKTLVISPTIWARNFIKSWGDIKRSLLKTKLDIDPMTVIKSDVVSRPNALNGKYETGKYDVGVKFEEAFPSSLPGRLPIVGRLFKGAETAFNGGALRMRADLADKYIKLAESQGIDMLNPTQAVPMGKLVNSMTGRGSLGRFESAGGIVNVFFFSARFLKANIDFLTAHRFDPTFSPFARKVATQNLMKVVAATGGVLLLADTLHPGSVEWDPTSSDFGKIKIGNTRFDISGGASGVLTLAARATPHFRNGEWGWWFTSAKTGRTRKLNQRGFGKLTLMDVVENFIEGKFSPLAGVFRDLAKGQNFAGEPVTPFGTIKSLVTPIPITTAQELQADPDSADFLMSMILENLGISANTF